MAFFDQNVTKITNNNDPREQNVIQPVVEENDVNRKNREEYESLMEESKTNLDSYYDKNNVFVKLVLFLLFVFIVCGLIYYTLLYLKAR